MEALSVKLPARKRKYQDDVLTVGLVNNMPDGALESTERQFRELLRDAAQRFSTRVSVRVFSIPEILRGEVGNAYVAERCEDIGALWGSGVEGLIVTGMEPKAQSLEDEPYWDVLAKVIDWAREHTVSTIWSCLAAHAAVYRLDAIPRRPFPRKLLGVFDCVRAIDHPLVAGMPARWHIPHSRYNDLPEAALTAAGYRILSRSPEAGADAFIKTEKSLFVFFQGHPEYDADSLFREYRRDVRRYLNGERESYPRMPRDYFDLGTAASLDAFRQRALKGGACYFHARFPDARVQLKPQHEWYPAAARLYANWLSHLIASRSSAAEARSGAAPLL